jgi:LuxR family quorum-sensing system transcriptional regulator CciR
MLVDDFAQASFSVDTMEALHAAFGRAIGRHGFEHYACTVLRPTDPLIDAVSTATAVKYPADWIARYVEADYASIDPIMTKSLSTAEPFFWADLVGLSSRQKRLFGDAADAGLRTGIGVPIHSPFGEVFIMSVASPLRDIDARRARLQMYLLTAQFRLVHLELVPGSPDRNRPTAALTDRERECLLWSARGKSSWDIGMIIGISEFTANFHIRNACAKLQATNRILGITKAIRLGLINP